MKIIWDYNYHLRCLTEKIKKEFDEEKRKSEQQKQTKEKPHVHWWKEETSETRMKIQNGWRNYYTLITFRCKHCNDIMQREIMSYKER